MEPPPPGKSSSPPVSSRPPNLPHRSPAPAPPPAALRIFLVPARLLRPRPPARRRGRPGPSLRQPGGASPLRINAVGSSFSKRKAVSVTFTDVRRVGRVALGAGQENMMRESARPPFSRMTQRRGCQPDAAAAPTPLQILGGRPRPSRGRRPGSASSGLEWCV